MSTRVGDESGFVDTQGLEVENVTDGLIYEQVLSVSPADADHNMNFHQLTNDTVDKTFSLTNAAFDIVLMVTQPELTALLNLTIPVQSQLTNREWAVRITDQSNRTTTISGTAVMKELKILDTGLGAVQLNIRLEFVTAASIGVLNF